MNYLALIMFELSRYNHRLIFCW